MEPKNFKRGSPEKKIEDALKALLRSKGWYVVKMHGSMYQAGIPDLYAIHPVFGPRWIELKNPKKFQFTPAQKIVFAELSKHGANIWILTAATEDEYKRLFNPPNWAAFLIH